MEDLPECRGTLRIQQGSELQVHRPDHAHVVEPGQKHQGHRPQALRATQARLVSNAAHLSADPGLCSQRREGGEVARTRR